MQPQTPLIESDLFDAMGKKNFRKLFERTKHSKFEQIQF